MPKLVSLKKVQISIAITFFWLIAIKIQTIFNRASSGICKLAIEKLITFLESRKELPL